MNVLNNMRFVYLQQYSLNARAMLYELGGILESCVMCSIVMSCGIFFARTNLRIIALAYNNLSFIAVNDSLRSKTIA